MNIALINGSPRKKDSSSGALLEDIKQLLPAEHHIKEFHLNKSELTEEDIKEMQNCTAWVFAFPLYVDAIPSQLLSCLCQLEKAEFDGSGAHVYAFVNCGFYEGRQARHALSIMEVWCQKAGLQWGMGVGFGGGGPLAKMGNIPLGKGPKRTLGNILSVLVDAILALDSKDNVFASISLPRFVYRFASEVNWRKSIKANGGKVRDLDRRL